MWTGDYAYLLRQLVAKDFKIRYRNMSLGMFWSLLNPLVMMIVYNYVFTTIFKNSIPYFPVHFLCAIIPFNFFAIALTSSTTCILDNSSLVKRTPIRREIIPFASILSSLPHVAIQFGLLMALVLISGLLPNRNWVWLPVVWVLQLIFLMGIGLIAAALYVFVRDMRYIVESVLLLLFWVVPIVYSFEMVPPNMRDLYQYNPLAALVLAFQMIIIKGNPPPVTLLVKLTLVSISAMALGLEIFKRAERRFYEYL